MHFAPAIVTHIIIANAVASFAQSLTQRTVGLSLTHHLARVANRHIQHCCSKICSYCTPDPIHHLDPETRSKILFLAIGALQVTLCLAFVPYLSFSATKSDVLVTFHFPSRTKCSSNRLRPYTPRHCSLGFLSYSKRSECTCFCRHVSRHKTNEIHVRRTQPVPFTPRYQQFPQQNKVSCRHEKHGDPHEQNQKQLPGGDSTLRVTGQIPKPPDKPAGKSTRVVQRLASRKATERASHDEAHVAQFGSAGASLGHDRVVSMAGPTTDHAWATTHNQPTSSDVSAVAQATRGYIGNSETNRQGSCQCIRSIKKQPQERPVANMQGSCRSPRVGAWHRRASLSRSHDASTMHLKSTGVQQITVSKRASVKRPCCLHSPRLFFEQL